ncbi:unnamed protein product [Somion occarium]|uniref:JmjC domain-containing protein n=1 Tax=Somion occarium TaxID=3059160 RepID=A0ABP1CY72_9APHY
MTDIDERRFLRHISQEYFDLNGTHYETFDTLPSSLDFSKMVRIARPVLIKECAAPVTLFKWTNEYLIERCADRPVSVAVTPNGRADAVTRGPDNKLYFTEPLTEQMPMAEFLSKLSPENNPSGEVHYLQSQNGNLRASSAQISEFESLLEDVPPHLHWCTDALDTLPDAVNLWIGDSRSVTSIHSDPYENIYSVIRGSKTFTLLPPTEGWCMNERTYPHATYERSAESSSLVMVPSPPSTPPIRWSSVIDPNAPHALPLEAHPIHITVNAGESLYLPAGWWHYVQQSGVTIAVNYWYDMESRAANEEGETEVI